MKVLHVLPRFNCGGAERMAVHLTRTLDRERFEVAAASLYDPVGTDLEGILARSEVPVWYLGKRSGLDRRMFARVSQIIREFRPDVVHTHTYVLRYVFPLLPYQRVAARVHTVHNVAEKEVDRPGRWVHRVAFRHGVLPVAIGEEVSASLTRVYGIEKFPQIPYGIPVKHYRRPRLTRATWREREGFDPEDVIFVCVARLSPQKNLPLLLESFARGPASDLRARLLLVGEGDLKDPLERQAAALGVWERVRFAGLRADIPEVLNAADVFVMSSDWEGNPLSIMEAMSAGKPVVSTAVGGVPELVEDGESGLLVPRGDAEALSRAMEHLLREPGIRESMGQASARRAEERFDVRVMTRAYERLYETVLGKN